MGFSKEAARQALLDNNNNVEAALNSLLAGTSQAKAAPVEPNRPPPRGTIIIQCAYISFTLVLHAASLGISGCVKFYTMSESNYYVFFFFFSFG